MRKLDSYNNYYNILFKLQQDIKNVIKYGLSECKTKDEAKKLYESKLGVFSSVTDSLNLPAIELEKFFTQSKKRVSEDLCNLEKEYVQAQELQKLDLIIAESDREDDFKELERQEKSKTL
jgi:hypothetical protein